MDLTELNFSDTNVDEFLPIVNLKKLSTLIFSIPSNTEFKQLRLVLNTLINNNEKIRIYLGDQEYKKGSNLGAFKSKKIKIQAYSNNIPIKNLSVLKKI